ncbi:response regulator transcription factor [soil metagenome]
MPAAAQRIRLLVVDDHPLFRRGVRSVIDNETDMQVVAEAGDGREAIAMFIEHRPEVVLMDLRMPGMGGVDAIRAIRELDAQARVLVLTTYHGDAEVRRAFDAGAKGYLLKSSVADVLAGAVRVLQSGGSFVPTEVAQSLADNLLSENLTSRELKVIECVAAGHSNASAARQLSISEDTVKSHMSNIMAKLNARDRTHAVAIAIERGMITGGH